MGFGKRGLGERPVGRANQSPGPTAEQSRRVDELDARLLDELVFGARKDAKLKNALSEACGNMQSIKGGDDTPAYLSAIDEAVRRIDVLARGRGTKMNREVFGTYLNENRDRLMHGE